MKTLKEILVPALLLLAICVGMTALLALTNEVTEPIIMELDGKSEIQAKQLVFPSAAGFSDSKQIEKDSAQYNYNEALDEAGNCIGFVFVTSAKGYGGDIRLMTGVNGEGEVTGISILALDETPGLGMKAGDEAFLKQFMGKLRGIGTAKSAPGENEIQALTGATISSRAVTEAVNLALELFEEKI